MGFHTFKLCEHVRRITQYHISTLNVQYIHDRSVKSAVIDTFSLPPRPRTQPTGLLQRDVLAEQLIS